jgi:hypothetical protein
MKTTQQTQPTAGAMRAAKVISRDWLESPGPLTIRRMAKEIDRETCLAELANSLAKTVKFMEELNAKIGWPNHEWEELTELRAVLARHAGAGKAE